MFLWPPDAAAACLNAWRQRPWYTCVWPAKLASNLNDCGVAVGGGSGEGSGEGGGGVGRLVMNGLLPLHGPLHALVQQVREHLPNM